MTTTVSTSTQDPCINVPMGYYYTVEPENAVPPKFCATPKTHVPGPPVKERGYRYYQPEVGQWATRDPLGEDGGVNLKLFLQNSAMDDIDSLGMQGFVRSLVLNPAPTLKNHVADYTMSIKIKFPPQSSWPPFTRQFWQLNHWIDQGYGVSAGGEKILMNKSGDITDTASAIYQNGSSVGYGYDNMSWGTVPFYPNIRSACFFSRSVTKTMGWNGTSNILSAPNTSGTTPTNGSIGDALQMRNHMRARQTYTYRYEFKNYRNCDCLKLFVGPIQLSLRGKTVESLTVPGIAGSPWEFITGN